MSLKSNTGEWVKLNMCQSMELCLAIRIDICVVGDNDDLYSLHKLTTFWHTSSITVDIYSITTKCTGASMTTMRIRVCFTEMCMVSEISRLMHPTFDMTGRGIQAHNVNVI